MSLAITITIISMSPLSLPAYTCISMYLLFIIFYCLCLFVLADSLGFMYMYVWPQHYSVTTISDFKSRDSLQHNAMIAWFI